MFLHSAGYLCVCVFFLGVESQRGWGPSRIAYNPAFSNSWNPNNGFPISNSKSPFGEANDGGSRGSQAFGFGGKPNEKLSSPPSEKKSNWGQEASSNSGRNRGIQTEVNGGTSAGRESDSYRRPYEKEPSSIVNRPGLSKWNANSEAFPSGEDDGLAVSPWGSSNAGTPPSGQIGTLNPKRGDWNSNNLSGNHPKDNEILPESGYEDDSNYPSWGSSDKKKNKPTFGSFGSYGNRETTTQRNYKNAGTSKWEAKNSYKPQNPSASDSKDTSQIGKENPTANADGRKEKPSTLDASILDELDKNDWYFGKESNYPKPPFRSTLNIDVSELWNFDKSKKPNENSRESSNNGNNESNNKKRDYNKNKYGNNNSNVNKNNSRRWNRQIRGSSIECECVNVNLCEEEDMIISQEDVKFELRPLEEFRCETLTDVCCTNPKIERSKMKLSNRANFDEENQRLQCGERKLGDEQFSGIADDVAQPGEFPWNLRLENAETNCSASLIHHRMALTAAHCVAGTLPGELILKAGIWNSNGEPSQRRRVIKIIPHPDYSSRNPRNDIALLVAETAFELTNNVNTICLPVTNDKWDSSECAVAGWRRLEEIHGQVLEVLEKGVVNFLPQPECQNIMLVTDLWRNYVLHDSFVCGLERTGRKSCTGDEGGSVICPSKKRPGTFTQIGIVSKGMNCDEFGRPGIFTNILHFLDWINKNYFELGLFDDIDVRSLTESQ